MPRKGIKMKMNKSVLQRGIIFLLYSCILFSLCPVYAFAAENQKEKVVRIGSSKIYFAIGQSHSDLKTELDNAMRRITDDDTYYADELHKQLLSYVREGKETTNGYSDAGDGWIRSKQTDVENTVRQFHLSEKEEK